MAADIKMIAQQLLDLAGGIDNFKELFNCMTRVRFVLKDETKADLEAVKRIPGVMGAVKQGEQYQAIIGPGLAVKVREAMEELAGKPVGGGIGREAPVQSGKELKTAMKDKFKTPLSGVLKRLGAIFVPLIPSFIACGILLGIGNMLKSPAVSGDFALRHPDIVGLAGVLGGSIFLYMNAIVGFNAAKEFGGSPALGAAFAGVLNAPGLSGLVFFGQALTPGRGGIIAVLIVAWFGAFIEKRIRKVMPTALELFLTPLLTLIIGSVAALAVLQPLGGLLSDGISRGATFLLNIGGPIVGFVLAGTFLPLVMTGIHQGLTPIMLDMLERTGVNQLLPVLAMAGAGQVGAGLAVLVKTKNKKLKETAVSALPAGFLGVGEPLIYGVTLPLGRPFLGSCIGGACGGAVIGFFKVAAVVPGGISGLVLAAGIVPAQIFFYLLAVLAAYGGGFIATLLLGFKDPPEGAL